MFCTIFRVLFVAVNRQQTAHCVVFVRFYNIFSQFLFFSFLISFKKIETILRRKLGITTSVSTIQSDLFSSRHGHRQVFSKMSILLLSRTIAKLCICLFISHDIYGPAATRCGSLMNKSMKTYHLVRKDIFYVGMD